jgi:predicted molibdopterin-dependent oxidoreductase YjgC
MCDFGRASHERYADEPRLLSPMVRRGGELVPCGWREAIDALFQGIRVKRADGVTAFLGSGFLTTEEAFLIARLADLVESPHRAVWVESGPERTIPNPAGGVTGRDAAPNRRGVELAGLVPGPDGLDADALLKRDGADRCAALFVADSDLGHAARDAEIAQRLRRARFLAVMGWADSPLARLADVVLPAATHAEREGTFVNVQSRLQRFDRAFPPPSQVRPALEILVELLSRFDGKWSSVSAATAFDLLTEEVETFDGLRWAAIPPTGGVLAGSATGGAP